MQRTHFTLTQDFVQLSAERPILFRTHDVRESIAPHNHEFAELALIQEGRIEHITFDAEGQEKREILEPGDFVVVPPGPAHAYAVREGASCQVINIYYLAEWFLWDLDLMWDEGLVPLFFASHVLRRPEALRVWRFGLSREEVASVEREVAEIGREYGQPSPSLLFVRGAFVKVLVILARAWHRQIPQGDLHFRPEIWRAIQAVDRSIKEGRGFRVEAFAREVGLAPGSFSRLFLAATGLSPSTYFGRRRTQHAAHLLLESELSVGEIASRLGFSDSAHLSRQFLRNERSSPSAFRARYRRAG